MSDEQTQKDHVSTDPIMAEDHIEPRHGLRVVAAAVRLKNGRVICGVRHFDKLMRGNLPTLIEAAHECLAGHEEGFVTNAYEFVDRNRAWEIAEAAEQIRWEGYLGIRGCLFSEDLW